MSENLFDLKSEVAVVIGGTGAWAAPWPLLWPAPEPGWRSWGVTRERGQQRADSISSAGGTALFHSADALDRDSLAAACDAIGQQWGPPSVLVNAAGGNRPDATLPPAPTSASSRSPPGKACSI